MGVMDGERSRAAFGLANCERGHLFMEGATAATDQDASFANRASNGSFYHEPTSSASPTALEVRPKMGRLPAVRVWTLLRIQGVLQRFWRSGSGASVCPAC